MFCTCRVLPYGYLLGHSSGTNTLGHSYVVGVHNTAVTLVVYDWPLPNNLLSFRYG